MEGKWKEARVSIALSVPIKTWSGVRYFSVMTVTPAVVKYDLALNNR
jgi:hypothetical protein